MPAKQLFLFSTNQNEFSTMVVVEYFLCTDLCSLSGKKSNGASKQNKNKNKLYSTKNIILQSFAVYFAVVKSPSSFFLACLLSIYQESIVYFLNDANEFVCCLDLYWLRKFCFITNNIKFCGLRSFARR